MKEISISLSVEDTVLAADLNEKLTDLTLEFKWVCRGKGLKINSSKSKSMKIRTKLNEDDWSGSESGSGLDRNPLSREFSVELKKKNLCEMFSVFRVL